MAALPDPSPVDPSPRLRHLLKAARAAFIAHGYGGVSIDALARDAGVSKETIYRHFADKPALFRAALDDLAAEFAARTAALHAAAPSPGVELEGLALAVLDSAVEGGLLSPLRLAVGVAGSMPEFAAELQALQWARMEPVRQVLEDLTRARGFAIDVPLSMALDFGSLAVSGPALLLGFPPPEPDVRALDAARVAAIFEHGVLRAAVFKGPPGPGEKAIERSASSPEQAPPPHIRALLDVAARHFLSAGYEGASLLEIGAEARVGRGTLYRHFGSKAGLFAAVLRDLAVAVANEARVPSLPGSVTGDDAAVESLTAFVAAAQDHLGGERSLALHRAAVAAAPRDPALARAVYDIVRAAWVAPLADWLERVVRVTASRWLAEALLVLALRGNRLLVTGRELDGAAAAAHARRMARLFVMGYAVALVAEAVNIAQ